MINKLETLYRLLMVRSKMPDKKATVQYLDQIWGCDQITISKCLGISQPTVSLSLQKKREIPTIEFTSIEIDTIIQTPYELFTDIEVIAFIHDILKLKVMHPLFTSGLPAKPQRIVALRNLGIQVDHIAKVFGTSKPYISQVYKQQLSKPQSNYRRSYRYAKEFKTKVMGV